ncbi:HesA/MoeB/ThiF family protein [Hydromonas duriensis]|uniref:Molybdopterin/thiamine biosynthesis adenylyltransferase n=1 Tax=Hydromonas duriensis TaxID=1527608 RepID=A0A4R6YA07_9BURK|nr:molybdopterin-synthase adenylyltransferase MoeB [Hydromonas duriensis]TDR32362.1 molybdopterin/thiamine biosynthesis adenylyltransferase [Hydromonas duriensis]
MNDTQLLRYARHIQLADIDILGQERILASHVLIVGAGGLGSPAALYLAASGVGHLTLIDDDVVELSNLQRQIIHTTDSLGLTKVASAQAQLQSINPDVGVNARAQRADADTLNPLLPHISVVLDCSDNFETRQMINRLCVQHRVPLVSGAAIRFEGQISVFDSRDDDSPCYACLFPPESNFNNEPCATLGVFAPLVGIIGAMQAAEALKIIVQMKQPLVGQLLTLDARLMEWQRLSLQRNPYCPVCQAQTSF